MVAPLAATTLVACSGGPSKEDFVAAADEACRAADARISEIAAPAGRAGVGRYVERARDISDDLVADLRALDPPDSDRGEVEELIDGLERAAALLEPLARAAVGRDAERIAELQQEILQITDDVSDHAGSYGFEVCGAKVLDPVR